MITDFSLKRYDTRPVFEVVLHDPPPVGSQDGTVGPVHDLTGASAQKLHIKLADGTVLTRNMVIEGLPTAGTLRYTWIATDWDAVSAGGTVGGLVVGDHEMEYEVISGTSRMTFPNRREDNHKLHITLDIANG